MVCDIQLDFVLSARAHDENAGLLREEEGEVMRKSSRNKESGNWFN